MIGHLAVITSATENTFLRRLANDARGWLGADDKATEGTFILLGGAEMGLSPVFTEWKSGQPDNNNNEDCLEMNQGWNDQACSFISPGYYVEYECPAMMIEGAYGCTCKPRMTLF
jgi:hypothetical protein